MSGSNARAWRAQAGFTLIEMSIVLVIIGLIIGGILKGQEIIESSRQKNLIVELDAMRSATGTFVDRFQALPGDFAFASSATAGLARISTDTTAYKSGDGNGVIGPGTLGAGAAAMRAAAIANTANSENVQFFVHLFGARLIGGVTPSATVASSFGEGSPLPAVAFPGNGLTIFYGTYNDFLNDTKTGHWLRVNKNAGGAGPGLSPKAMYAVDSKTDDGIPSRGAFRSGLDATNCGTGASGVNDYGAADESLICTGLVFLAN